MNVRRGLFRIWIVASLGWVAVIVGVAYRSTSIPSLTRSCSELLDFKADSTGQKLTAAEVAACDRVWHQERLSIIENAVAPPFVLLLIGFILAWIANGFRSKPRDPTSTSAKH